MILVTHFYLRESLVDDVCCLYFPFLINLLKICSHCANSCFSTVGSSINDVTLQRVRGRHIASMRDVGGGDERLRDVTPLA